MQSAKESVKALHSLLTRRKRFTNGHGALGLDLAYITDRVIVCSFPYELPLFFSRNTAGDLLKFLESTHKDHYKVYNLCSERTYDHTKFKGNVAEFPVNINEAPQLYTIYSFIKDANKWLDEDPMNVICVHCDNGRDRTGMMISAWLLQTRRCLTTSHAITFFASVRGGISPCVTTPSQRRVLTEKMPAIKLVVLEKITIYTVPMFNIRGGCSPWFSISKLNKSIFYSKSLEGKKGKMTIDFECNFIQLQGDIVITFFDGKFSRLMFRISFHSSFIRGKTVTFYPRDIDGPHADVNHKNFHPEFKVTLHFSSVALLPAEQISPDDVVPQTKKYTFEDILNIATLREAFRTYLDATWCSENLDFWKLVQRYKEAYVPSVAKAVATKIYNKYLVRYTPDEVNVSHAAKEEVEAGINQDIPPPDLFELAQKEVYGLMRNDSYPRFIISDLFFKACTELSDYSLSDSSRLPETPSSKSIRANTATTTGNEKTPNLKRFPTSAADSSSSSFYPLNPNEELTIIPTTEKYDYSSPFKALQDYARNGIRRKDQKESKVDYGMRIDPSSTSTKITGSKSKLEIPKLNTESTKPKTESEDRADTPRKKGKDDQVLELKKSLSSEASFNPPSKLNLSTVSQHPSSPRVYHPDSDKLRGDFIKADYRSKGPLSSSSPAFIKESPHQDSSSIQPALHRELVSSPIISITSPANSPASNPQGSFRSMLRSSTGIVSQPPSLSVPTTPLPKRPSLRIADASSSNNFSPSTSTPRPLPARPLSPTPISRSSSPEPEGHLARQKVSQRIQSLTPARPPSATLSHSVSAPSISISSVLQQPKKSTPLNSRSDDGSEQSFRPRPGGLSSNSNQKHQLLPQPPSNNSQTNVVADPKENHSPKSTHSQLHILNSNHQHKEFPPRPETPSTFSPSDLSFEHSDHENPKSPSQSCTNKTLPPNVALLPPSVYPSPRDNIEPSETIRVMDNIKLVCVECRKQIGNKDVVVSFMHHYYHWSCVRCFKCHQPLSSDCVISGDKPYCGKCDDCFFNKCTACGLAITETAEEQRIDLDGNLKSPIEKFQGDNKLYCVFHHPEPKSVPAMSAQDIRDASDDSLDPSDDSLSDDGESPPPSPPRSPVPSRSVTPLQTPKPLPAVPSQSHSQLPPKSPTKKKPLPPIPLKRPTVMTTPPPAPSLSTPTSTATSSITTTTPHVQQRHYNTPDDAYFTGVCTACTRKILKTGNLLLAGQAQYHPSCFVCSVCATPITGSYHETDGAVFCPRHVSSHRVKCAGCSGGISPGQYLVVANEKYHLECFSCKLCGLQFGTEHSYYDLWGGHICIQCYEATQEVKTKSRLFRRT